MSDFFNSGWSVWVALVSGLGIAGCLWLLFSQRKTAVPRNADGTVTDTGHTWDGDLRELNNPLPRWWMWMYVLGCTFAIVYLVLYPGMGSFPGVFGYSTTKALQQDIDASNAELKPIYAKYMTMDIKQVAADPKAHEIGQRLFLNNCAQCHGSDAGGGKGFPNLTDSDWLYGGDPETIRETILHGRQGAMPAWSSMLNPEQIKDVASYVRSLSGMEVDQARAKRGEETFKTTCAACHGEKATGTQAMGAPNLTDRTWLYGGTDATVVETITKGRAGQMPAWEQKLTPEKIQMLVAYVWSLSNKTDAAAKQ